MYTNDKWQELNFVVCLSAFGAVCLHLQQWNTTDNNNNLNVNNRVLEFIDKKWLVRELFPQTLLQKLPSKTLMNFRFLKVRLKAIYFLRSDVNFACDLACTYQNVCKCTRSLPKACKMPFIMLCKLKLKDLAKKLECIKCLQSNNHQICSIRVSF